MKARTFAVLLTLVSFTHAGIAYPPAVGILSEAKSCLDCHVNNGPWGDPARTIVDIIDSKSKESFKQSDGTFLIQAKRGEKKTVLTIIGRIQGDTEEVPYRNAWLYLDPETIGKDALSKFTPGWDVNLPMACRIVGDRIKGYDGAKITVLPMSIMPTDTAKNSKVVLQVMLTKGESVKGEPTEGMVGNYFECVVTMIVEE